MLFALKAVAAFDQDQSLLAFLTHFELAFFLVA